MRLVSGVNGSVKEITVADLQAKQKDNHNFMLIDVREESEWAGGYISGAIHLSKGTIERDIEAKIPDFDTELVLYCRGGYRSLLAGDAVQKMGYSKVSSLAGGITAWLDVGLPLVHEG